MILTNSTCCGHTPETILLVLLCLLFLPFFEKVHAQQVESRQIEFPDAIHSTMPVGNQQVSEGWIALWDGHSLFGWRSEAESDWQVEDGKIVADQPMPGMLRTASQFDDYELVLEYQASKGGEATLFLRTSPDPASGDAIPIQLEATSTETQWKRLLVSADGNEVRASIDGDTVDFPGKLSAVQRGYIGLSCRTGKLKVRKVLILPLSIPVFNFVDGWHSTRDNGFQASIEDEGEIVLTGGPGYVESELQYANFIFQTKCSISPGGNSGIFYRCIPGENTNGYESQIDNNKVDGDFQRPANCGTGGIFRRKDARRIVVEDENWFAKTIVVEGPHVAVWVNGYQVTDWTDKRKPNDNPRRGLRTAAGTLMLQGHDAETTTRFRELKVRELKSRR